MVNIALIILTFFGIVGWTATMCEPDKNGWEKLGWTFGAILKYTLLLWAVRWSFI